MSTHVFVYGMLMFPELLQALTGRHFETLVASLPHYHRYCINAEQYPAVAPCTDATTQGKLLIDVDPDSIAIFDYFEDVDEGVFIKQSVEVIASDGHRYRAMAYIAGHSLQPQLTGTWNPEALTPHELSFYIDTVVIPCLHEFLEYRG